MDRLAKPRNHLVVWDYKTGRDHAYGGRDSDPLKQGRSMQPFIYMEMLADRLRSQKEKHIVKEAGLLYVSRDAIRYIYRWDRDKLEGGREILSLLWRDDRWRMLSLEQRGR